MKKIWYLSLLQSGDVIPSHNWCQLKQQWCKSVIGSVSVAIWKQMQSHIAWELKWIKMHEMTSETNAKLMEKCFLQVLDSSRPQILSFSKTINLFQHCSDHFKDCAGKKMDWFQRSILSWFWSPFPDLQPYVCAAHATLPCWATGN